ncbi:hypothetical protein [Roseateles koreensis]|uniref:Uncharacterized protein n=1 Tax=Roseateles koreensis TaxID=2987526 RepID=A0ABT5KPC6_9BURK|nr:hypothetical protein [Roseateles koreensis]MDC8784770.1 hypothetical protein [Roseateles koreensis]
MKISRKLALLGLTLMLSGTAAMATDVGVSVTIGQPGFYGRIDLGSPPPAAMIYAQPVVIQQMPGPVYSPLYLRVPPGHEKHWNKHCREYQACNRPVYFVRDDWYQRTYVERRDDRDHREYREDRREDRHDDRRDDRRGDRRDDDRHHDEGRGNGNGHGRGHDRNRD